MIDTDRVFGLGTGASVDPRDAGSVREIRWPLVSLEPDRGERRGGRLGAGAPEGDIGYVVYEGAKLGTDWRGTW